MYDLTHLRLPKDFTASRLQTEVNNAVSDGARTAHVCISPDNTGAELYIFTTQQTFPKAPIYDVDIAEQAGSFTDIEIEHLTNNAVSDGSKLIAAIPIAGNPTSRLVLITEAPET